MFQAARKIIQGNNGRGKGRTVVRSNFRAGSRGKPFRGRGSQKWSGPSNRGRSGQPRRGIGNIGEQESTADAADSAEGAEAANSAEEEREEADEEEEYDEFAPDETMNEIGYNDPFDQEN